MYSPLEKVGALNGCIPLTKYYIMIYQVRQNSGIEVGQSRLTLFMHTCSTLPLMPFQGRWWHRGTFVYIKRPRKIAMQLGLAGR
jgi:hypothetical protein